MQLASKITTTTTSNNNNDNSNHKCVLNFIGRWKSWYTDIQRPE